MVRFRAEVLDARLGAHSEPAAAGILVERPRHVRGLQIVAQRRDLLVAATRLPVDRVLEGFERLLEPVHPRAQPRDVVIRGDRRSGGLLARRLVLRAAERDDPVEDAAVAASRPAITIGRHLVDLSAPPERACADMVPPVWHMAPVAAELVVEGGGEAHGVDAFRGRVLAIALATAQGDVATGPDPATTWLLVADDQKAGPVWVRQSAVSTQRLGR